MSLIFNKKCIQYLDCNDLLYSSCPLLQLSLHWMLLRYILWAIKHICKALLNNSMQVSACHRLCQAYTVLTVFFSAFQGRLPFPMHHTRSEQCQTYIVVTIMILTPFHILGNKLESERLHKTAITFVATYLQNFPFQTFCRTFHRYPTYVL